MASDSFAPTPDTGADPEELDEWSESCDQLLTHGCVRRASFPRQRPRSCRTPDGIRTRPHPCWWDSLSVNDDHSRVFKAVCRVTSVDVSTHANPA